MTPGGGERPHEGPSNTATRRVKRPPHSVARLYVEDPSRTFEGGMEPLATTSSWAIYKK